jgi:hypothetical protein
MAEKKITGNPEVTAFLDGLKHPLRKEIEGLRHCLLAADKDLEETVKWNGPNYSLRGQDRITMKIHPPKQIQLVFHRGAKAQTPLTEPLIEDRSGLLSWRGHDRAVATFKTQEEITRQDKGLSSLIRAWLKATME